MVVHVDRTAKPIVKYALDFLGNAKILGVVMNSIEMNKISSLYYSYQYPNYAYYAYAYSYGYDYDYFYGEGGPKKRKPMPSLRKGLRNMSERIRRTIMPLE
jgi:Mrp family chromosome partitioning ATPase